MKILCSSLFVLFYAVSFSQAEIVVPESTVVPSELTQEIKEGKVKDGQAAMFVVSEDVKVNGTTVITKGTPVHAVMTSTKNRQLRIDMLDVKAIDGTVLKLNDCWMFYTAAQNLNGKGYLVIKGTKKNCKTSTTTTIKNSSKQY